MIKIVTRTIPAIFVTLFTASLLSACGGGGSSSSDNSLPSPQGLTAQTGNGSAELDWDLVEDATGYNLYYSTDPDIDINNPGSGNQWDWISDVTPPHTLDTLDNGVTYFIVVSATRGSQESAPSDEIAATPRAGISGREIYTSARSIAANSCMHSLSTVMCPEGQLAVGGGVRITSSDNDAALRIHSSFPSSTGAADSRTYGWTGRATNDNNVTQGSVSVDAYRICIDMPDGFDAVRRAGLTLAGNSSAVFETACPEDTVALSGGALLGGVNSDDPGVRLAYSQRDASGEDIWRTTLHNVSSNDHTNISANAVCAAPLRGLSMETSVTVRPDDFVPAGAFGERSVRCPAGQSVIHGGLYRLGSPDTQPTDLVLQQSYPDTDSEGRDVWRVRAWNSAAAAVPIGAYAMCADNDD